MGTRDSGLGTRDSGLGTRDSGLGKANGPQRTQKTQRTQRTQKSAKKKSGLPNSGAIAWIYHDPGLYASSAGTLSKVRSAGLLRCDAHGYARAAGAWMRKSGCSQ
ncbi:MAG: hypothetical protein CVV14_03790 [Gammaproteobacteria bacterium HGW-Gammaproteobacteria-4]|nr:MAG: hypothetical protein CVV14_03790 [Gammaproteobacteria bacterium HGW-Gammaproteobacteria-4]